MICSWVTCFECSLAILLSQSNPRMKNFDPNIEGFIQDIRIVFALQILQVIFGFMLFFVHNHKGPKNLKKCRKFWFQCGPWVHHLIAAYNYFFAPIIFLFFSFRYNTVLSEVLTFYTVVGVVNLVFYFMQIRPALGDGRDMAKMRYENFTNLEAIY